MADNPSLDAPLARGRRDAPLLLRATSGSPRASETKRDADGDRRCAAGVYGLDDLGVVDALEVDRGDAEVAVAELTLDDDERHALVRHLNGVGVAELVRCEASANARGCGHAAQLGAGGGC
jgi:hypothetical protein